MYGMNVIRPDLEKKSPPAEAQLPSTLDDVDSFLSKATTEKPSRIRMSDSVPGLESSSVLRLENEPYNQVYACDINEISPQKGEVRF